MKTVLVSSISFTTDAGLSAGFVTATEALGRVVDTVVYGGLSGGADMRLFPET
jgi:hypothetical protein